jgi:hypothetical protein
MSSKAGESALQGRRQALINLALKRDPIQLRAKPGVSFVNDSLPRNATVNDFPSSDSPVNELPSLNTYNVISPTMIVDELPPLTSSPMIKPTGSPLIKPTSARSISTISPIL